jgi:hypothetical protein
MRKKLLFGLTIALLLSMAFVSCDTGGGGSDPDPDPLPTAGGNPFLPLWERVPDGEPRVFKDPATGLERLYVYGSHDSRFSGYCGPDHVVWSAPVDDLTNWRHEGTAFHVNQLNDLPFLDADGETRNLIVQAVNPNLYAPDVVYHPENNKYYMYLFVDGIWNTGLENPSVNPGLPPSNIRRRQPMFVAESTSPAGPFINPKFVRLAFDPAVLVDVDNKNEDGKSRVYLYWTPEHYRNAWACELDPTDMATQIPGTLHVPFGEVELDIPTADANPDPVHSMPDWNAPFYMFEGSSIRKVNGIYIMAYCRGYPRATQTSTANISEIGWAYSDNPFGDLALGSPWTYGGVVVDNRGEQIADPYTATPTYTFTGGNVHGGMVEANGQWYQIYHRSTNIKSKRQAMAEPFDLSFLGGRVPVIDQVEMTSQGFGKNGLDPYEEHFAGIACYILPASGTSAPTFFSQTETSLETYNFDPEAVRDDWYPIGNIRNQSWVGYKYFNFGTGVGSGTLKLVLTLKESLPGTINIYANDPKEKYGDPGQPKIPIGTIVLEGTNSEVHTVEGVVQNLTGKKGIYLEFLSGETGEICQLNNLQFVK